MSPRHRRPSPSPAAASARLTRQLTELSLAVPQVVGHRLMRMAAAGHTPSDRDRQEFTRMGSEKLAAFSLAWQAMAWQWWQAPWAFWSAIARMPLSLGRPLHSRALAWPTLPGLLSAGVAPVHAAAVANAKRLGRVRR